MGFGYHSKQAFLSDIFNLIAPLKYLSEKTAFPSIIIDALPLFFSMFFIASIVFLSFNKPLPTANPFDILILFNAIDADLFILFFSFGFVIIDFVLILPKYLQ